VCSLLVVFFPFSRDGEGSSLLSFCSYFHLTRRAGPPSHSSHFDTMSPLIVSLFVYYVVTNVVIYY